MATARRAIVTGHSRGLGEGIAAALLERDVGVLGISRHKNSGLATKFSGLLQETTLDLADDAALQSWLAGDAQRSFFDGSETAMLVNNAGLLEPIGPLQKQDPAAVARAVAVNVGATLAMSSAFAQATDSVGDRRILHISSGAGRKAYAGWSVYCATKAAVDHHVRCVVMDRTPNLRIAAIAPGVVETEMQREIRESTDDRFPERPRFVAMKKEGRLKDPLQTGRAIVELLLARSFGDDPLPAL